jgi:hypothetical protein
VHGTIAHHDCSRSDTRTFRDEEIMLGTILIIILILFLLGSFPAWPYSRGWGYYPSGTLGLIVIVVIVLVLMGRV